MIWGWENIWFFAFAGALLILLLLYWLNYRGRTFFTQALFLWEENAPEERSSSKIFVRPLPLNFYLEAAALLLMVCGGAAFFTVEREKIPAAVILLNNSSSMASETRSRGMKSIEAYLKKFPGRSVIWVLCGTEPEILSRQGKTKDWSGKWNGSDRECNVPRALSWAKENFPGAEVCLVTDRVPENWSPEKFSLFCCGVPGDNIAIVNAGIRENRILLEIRSFARSEKEVLLKVNSRVVEKFSISADGRKLFNFTCDDPSEILTFTIDSPGDALEYDNKVFLVNTPQRPVTYSFGQLGPGEKRALEQVLTRNPEFRSTSGECELLFTSFSGAKEGARGHRFFFHKSAKSVLDRLPPFLSQQEPLLKGLSGASLVWAFSPGVELPGRGVIFSSSGPLLSVEQRAGRKYDFHLNLQCENSNLSSLPFWPGFFCNLADFCRRARPGAGEPNVKAGELITFNLSSGAEKLRFSSEAFTGELAASGGKSVFQLKQCGLYRVSDGRHKSFVAVNPYVTECSDLRRCRSFVSGTAGDLTPEEGRRSRSFLFIAGALILLLLDQTLLSRRKH